MEFLTKVTIAAVDSGGLVNDAMIQHLPTHASKMEDNTTIARMDTHPSALAAASGRPPLTFRNFVRQQRSAFGAAPPTHEPRHRAVGVNRNHIQRKHRT
jgi:hypothetical protein